jgi:cysteine desulfuration protein SufE
MDWNEKLKQLRTWFSHCKDQKETYQTLLALGKKLGKLESEVKLESNKVKGCQSLMYLKSTVDGNKIFFSADSEALISAGLAFLLTFMFSGESLEFVVKTPPDFLKELDINESLSPSRSSGLASLHLMMRQKAIKAFMKQEARP